LLGFVELLLGGARGFGPLDQVGGVLVGEVRQEFEKKGTANN
jgi:hypothetical protein